MLHRLIKLARKKDNFEAFIEEALKFPTWYGYPGKGTKDDWFTFYKMIRKGVKPCVTTQSF